MRDDGIQVELLVVYLLVDAQGSIAFDGLQYISHIGIVLRFSFPLHKFACKITTFFLITQTISYPGNDYFSNLAHFFIKLVPFRASKGTSLYISQY